MTKHSNYYNNLIQYCKDITSGKILSGIYCKKSIQRFMKDLKQSEEDGFPFYFNEYSFNEICEFAESLKLPDIKTNLKLLPWQLFIYGNLFGWFYKGEKERRRFRQAYIEVARKNGKTSGLLFPLILYDFLTSNAAESYLVSATGDQSEKSFEDIVEIINENKELKDICHPYSSVITLDDTSRITFFSSESTATDGYRNSLSVVDEYHDYDSDKIVTSFRYGGRARVNNLVAIITSAGLDISKPCYAENKKCKSILSGTLTDESYFGIIYAYDEKDDWKDSKNFIKANPSLGEFLKKDVLESDLTDALITPSHQPDFKSKTCGFWTNDTSSWIPLEKWEKTDKKLKYTKGINVYGGLDLSSVNDLTAYSLCWKIDGIYYLQHKFYIPEEQAMNKYKKDNINFLEWIQKGYITIIPGASIDTDYIYNDIEKDLANYNTKIIAYDKWQSDDLIKKLDENIPQIVYAGFDQSLKKMSASTKNYERLVLDGKIVDPNPVMTWMINNVRIKPDANNNYKPMKDYKSSTQRIDGVITSIMSVDMCISNEVEVKKESFANILNSF